MKGHEYAHAKHEAACLFQWKRRHFEQFCEIQFVPHHGSFKGGSLLDLRVNHKCNESTLEVKDNGGPT